jgi:uncharacterized damage-inducible protein DinB
MSGSGAVSALGGPIAPLYRGWHLANDALIAAIRPLTAEQLALPVGSAPVWAIAAHIAGARVFWLCHVFGEPGAETTPFADPSGLGWEDDLAHPRSADEIVHALESSWAIVDRCLASWTADTLTREARRTGGDQVRIHTRQSVLMRLITHDAYHCGEISLTLGAHGLGGSSPNGPIDMWAGLSRVER